MSLDFVFILNYPCPGCLVRLEARSSGQPSWLRCPRCGRPSIPPDQQSSGRSGASAASVRSDPTGGFVLDAERMPLQPRAMAPLPAASGSRPSNLRILLGLGFFLTLFLSVFSLLDSNPTLAAISGAGSLLCLSLAVVASGRRGKE